MTDDFDGFDIITDEPQDVEISTPQPKPPHSNGAGNAPRGPRFKLVSFNELTVGSRAVYLVKGIIPKAGLVVVWGPPKCGKSYWIFTVMLHVALGREYRGRRVQQGMVVYLALEGQDGFGARAAAFRSRYLDGTGDAPDFFLIKERTDLVRDHQALIQCIATQCEGEPTAVVIDTLNRSLAGSESDDKDMGAYVRAADAIREKFNCAVIIVHHCGVNVSRPRGHTSLTGAADMQISVKRDAAKNIIATVEYAKDGPEGAVIASKLEPVDLGRDEDGDPVTACVVMPVEDGGAPAAAKTPSVRKEKKVIRTFRDAFAEALDTDGSTIQVRGDGPKVRAVDVQKVKAEFERRYATGEADPKKCAEASRKAFRRTMMELPPQFATETKDSRELIWKIGTQ
jgi:AAA domain